ncbi:cytochrome-c oxidase [Bacillus tuaregi]|uniref:cytochrome-c oxidase n=1 Tax=Bacillus tuaregi TaxID=1816695 RepID=UPI0008F8D256|nr:cytochrome-c oxidase [Bacillus tuaregi]
MGNRLIKIAALYFVIGVGLGLYMSMAHSYDFVGVHAHVNLLGWLSLAVIGAIYSIYPELSTSKLAKTHFWLHNIALPIMMIGLFFLILGQEALVPVVAASGTVMVLAILLFAFNVWMNLKPKA